MADFQLNLVDDAPTLVLLDTVPAMFVDGIENIVTHRITPGVTGWYSIAGKVSFCNPVAGTNYSCYLQVSDLIVALSYATSHASFGPAIDDLLTVQFTLPCYHLTWADFLDLWVISRSGDNTVDIGHLHTFLSCQRVR